MKHQFISLLTFSAFTFFVASCNSNEEKKPIVGEQDNLSAHAQLSAGANGVNTTAPVNQTQDNAKQSAEKPTLNPQHGQPGHRCDLAVGAPLPVNGETKQVATTNQTPAPSAKPNDANPVLVNPEHGQPGHRCDLQVGAPLNTPAPKQ